MPVPDHTVGIQRIPETLVEGRRLGAHFEKDSRSRDYPIERWIVDKGGTFQTDPTKLESKRWTRNIPPLDQGELGSCVGNASVGMVACSPIWDIDHERFKSLREDEGFGVRVYQRATTLDGLGHPYYPPSDRGSTTLGGLKALRAMGMIDEFRWGFGLVDALNALALAGAGITGVFWFEGFDEPTADGTLRVGGGVRGGHELVLDEIKVEEQQVWGTNSWGDSWDQQGRFGWTWDTFGSLLDQQGEFGIGVWR